jgi:hypothetical protein
MNVIEGKFDPDPAVVAELRKVLALAEKGEVVAVSIACVHRGDEVSTMWTGRKRITLLGAMRCLEHEMFCYGAGILDERDREPPPGG